MKTELIRSLTQDFESASHTADDVEYWLARELQELLGYTEWRNFAFVIEKAKTACMNAGQDIGDHFVDVNKMLKQAEIAKPADHIAGVSKMVFTNRNGSEIALEAVGPALLTPVLLNYTTNVV